MREPIEFSLGTYSFRGYIEEGDLFLYVDSPFSSEEYDDSMSGGAPEGVELTSSEYDNPEEIPRDHPLALMQGIMFDIPEIAEWLVDSGIVGMYCALHPEPEGPYQGWYQVWTSEVD